VLESIVSLYRVNVTEKSNLEGSLECSCRGHDGEASGVSLV
jgi:hypothetical protein